MSGREPEVKMRPTSFEDGKLASSTTARKQECQRKESQFIDDMTLFMAWHNWYLTEQNRFLSAMCMFQQHAQQQMHLSMVSRSSQRPSQETNHHVGFGDHSQNLGGVSVKISSFKKRIAAEFIDFLFLLVVKIFVITYVFGDPYIDKFQYVLVIDENTTLEDLQVTLIQALLFRLVAIAYEGYCLSGTLPFSNRGTLGKRVMGIELIRCEIVEDVDAVERQVRVIPGGHVGALRSLVRATMKNIIISLFFPMLLPLHMIMKHNRLIYDIATGTIVVDKV